MGLPFIEFRNIGNDKRSRNSIENLFFLFFCKLIIGNCSINIFMITDNFQNRCIIRMCRPGKEGSFTKRKIWTDDIFFSKCRRTPESMTCLTSSMMGIKRKIRYRKIFLHIATERTCCMLIKVFFIFRIEEKYTERTVPFRKCKRY